jgi:glycerophosphoryl diester phosphodiesterase
MERRPASASASAPVRPITVTAHAGSLDTAANSPESCRAALALPVDYLEADVRFGREQAPYLAHDALAPQAQGSAMSLPALLEMAAAHPTVKLNLDLKEYAGVRELRAQVERSGMRSRVLLTGITADVVARVRGELDGLPYLLNARPGLGERLTGAGARRLARRIRECGALGLNTHYSRLTRRLARVLRAQGLQVSVWTVDNPRAMRRMLRLGVDNITTRRVDTLLAQLAERGRAR